jgi:DNA polymerase-3 subunit beta
VTCKSVAGDDRTLVVPGTLLEKLALSLPSSDDDEEVTVTIGENSCTVSWGDDSIRVVMRALAGTYPDTDRIIPMSTPNKVTVERQALLEACDRVSILSMEDHQQSTILVSADRIAISANSAQYGRAADEVTVTSSQLKDESLQYLFNINYWLSALRSMDDVEQIDIQMLSINQPIVMTPVGGTGLALLSPMQQAKSNNTTQAS